MESSTAQFLWRQFACVQLPTNSLALLSYVRGGIGEHMLLLLQQGHSRKHLMLIGSNLAGHVAAPSCITAFTP